jgi:hypothetical protein
MSDSIISVRNGVEVVLTGEELAEFNEQQQSLIEQIETAQAEAQAKADARESALAKLAALGLTQDEINAL